MARRHTSKVSVTEYARVLVSTWPPLSVEQQRQLKQTLDVKPVDLPVRTTRTPAITSRRAA